MNTHTWHYWRAQVREFGANSVLNIVWVRMVLGPTLYDSTKAPNQITMNHFLMFNYGITQHCFRFIRRIKSIGSLGRPANTGFIKCRCSIFFFSCVYTWTFFRGIFILCVIKYALNLVNGLFILRCLHTNNKVFSINQTNNRSNGKYMLITMNSTCMNLINTPHLTRP